MRPILLSLTSLLALSLVSARSTAGDQPPPYDWHALDRTVGVAGTMHDDVYTYTLPRTDLDVAVDGMAVPAAAGIASQFNFFRCPCGKIRVVGQFCCADYEANDVIDAIRPGAMIQVAAVGPMFTLDKPRLTIVRFQGEGDASALAKLLHDGLTWMGEARFTNQQAKPPTTTQPTR